MRPLLIFLALLATALAGSRPSLAEPAAIILCNPSTSTVPSHFCLVGQGPGGADVAAGQVSVTYRDFVNFPVPNGLIVWDFSGCGDLRIAAVQPEAGLAVSCGARTVSALTDPNGVARFTIVGGGRGGVGNGLQEALLYAECPSQGQFMLLARVPVAAFDLDGNSGVALLDLSRWAADFFGGTNPSRSDYDGDGLLTGLDLALWCSVFFEGGSVMSASDYCP